MGKRPMTKVGRAVEKGETFGFMKVLIDADTQRIMGAAILGTGGDEAIHSILDVMYADKPYTVIQRAMHIHPTVSELIPTMLGEATAALESRRSLPGHAERAFQRHSRAPERAFVEQAADQRHSVRHASRRRELRQRIVRVGRPVAARLATPRRIRRATSATDAR